MYTVYSDELKHHGILKQKWGVRHGPPYPLKYNQHSAAQKKANKKSDLDNYGSEKKTYGSSKATKNWDSGDDIFTKNGMKAFEKITGDTPNSSSKKEEAKVEDRNAPELSKNNPYNTKSPEPTKAVVPTAKKEEPKKEEPKKEEPKKDSTERTPTKEVQSTAVRKVDYEQKTKQYNLMKNQVNDLTRESVELAKKAKPKTTTRTEKMDLSGYSNNELRSILEREKLEREFNSTFGKQISEKAKRTTEEKIALAGSILAVGLTAASLYTTLKGMRK